MMRLLLVRHGLTDWNVQERFQGQADIPLNAAGRRQAAALAKRLVSEPLAAVYASDLIRARETAEAALAGRLRQSQDSGERLAGCDRMVFDPGLRELCFGEWEGLTYEEIKSRDPLRLAAWEADLLNAVPPGGESLLQLAARVEDFLQRLQSAPWKGPLAIVGHGGPLQVLLCLALGLPPRQYWQLHLEPGSLSEVCFYPAGAVLNLLNDTCHLRAGGLG